MPDSGESKMAEALWNLMHEQVGALIYVIVMSVPWLCVTVLFGLPKRHDQDANNDCCFGFGAKVGSC